MVEIRVDSPQTDLLPEGWKSAKLGELAIVKAGGSAPQGDRYFDGTYPFVRVQHLNEGDDWVRRWDLITDEAVRDYSLKPFPKGTIVLPKSGASIRLEKRAILPIDSYVVSHLATIIPKPNTIDRDFLFYFLRLIRLAREKADGYPTLSLTEIERTPIAFPPFPEQKAIAHILRTVQRAKEATEKVTAATRQLKESLMRHLFTYGPVPFDQAGRVELKEMEIGLVPQGWDVVPLGEVVIETQYGLSKRGEATGQYPILRMNSLYDGCITTDDLQYVDLDDDEFAKFRLNRGDILFNRTNSYELVGKTSLFDLSEDYVFASYLIRVVPDSKRLRPEYLSYYFNTEFTQNRLRQLATRGVSQSNISATKLKGFAIPLPPLLGQKKIGEILTQVDCKLKVEESKKQTLDALFKSLLHHLMTGKVRVKDLPTN
jgi:type I restriction enzyme S subunit